MANKTDSGLIGEIKTDFGLLKCYKVCDPVFPCFRIEYKRDGQPSLMIAAVEIDMETPCVGVLAWRPQDDEPIAHTHMYKEDFDAYFKEGEQE